MASTIGTASRKSGVHIETIRYYEKSGLIVRAERTTSGHRVYTAAQIDQLKFIKRCRELGLPLARISELISLVDARDRTCDQVKSVLLEQLHDVRQNIEGLKNLEQMLDGLARACDGGATPDCSVIHTLYSKKTIS